MADCYDYEMNSGVQESVKLNLQTFRVQSLLSSEEAKQESRPEMTRTEREMLKFSAVRYGGSYSSVCVALCR